jgi:uncharacterized membrane protein YdjX (TVP38/TMEM64 family)
MYHRTESFLKWLGVLSLPLLYFVPAVRVHVNEIGILLFSADFNNLKQYILSFGFLAPIVSIALMMFQALLAPLPSLVLVLANAWAFGWVWGAIYSWLGGMLGSALCFFVARWYGRPAVEKLFGRHKVDKVDVFFRNYGQYAILVARLTPIFSFDLISYAAGLTAIDIGTFLWATAIGQLPAIILYSMLGENLSNGASHLLWAIPIVILLVLVGIGIKHWLAQQNNLQQ